LTTQIKAFLIEMATVLKHTLSLELESLRDPAGGTYKYV